MKKDNMQSGDVRVSLLSDEGKVLAVNIDISNITDENIDKAALILSAIRSARNNSERR